MALVSAVNTINGQPVYAKYAVKDVSARRIVDTYATKDELSAAASGSTEALGNVSAYLSAAITDVSGTLDTATAMLDAKIVEETGRATAAEIGLSGELDAAKSDISDLNNALEAETGRAESEEGRLAGEIGSLSAAVDSYITDLKNYVDTADEALDRDIQAESDRAEASENSLSDTLGSMSATVDTKFDETGARMASVSAALRESLDDEKTRAEAAENAITDAVDALSDYVTETDAFLSAGIDRVSAGVDFVSASVDSSAAALAADISELSDTFDSVTGAMSAAVSTSAESLSRAIAAETERATGIESGIRSDLDDEIAERRADVYDINADIDDLGNELETVSGNLKTFIDNEEARATAAEVYLSGSIDYLGYYVSSGFDALNADIGAEYERALSAEYDLTVTKQNVMSAGDGIDITDDIVSHSVKVIENDDEEDTVEDTIMDVYLKNNRYKVITLDPTVTEIHFWITKTETGVLQETGFEFQVPANSVLNDLEFRVVGDDTITIYTIIPKAYKAPNIYQGTIVNYRCTVGEYKVE